MVVFVAMEYNITLGILGANINDMFDNSKNQGLWLGIDHVSISSKLLPIIQSFRNHKFPCSALASSLWMEDQKPDV
ncbi:unnamed protein product [Nezara viridula]|uniref:Uncharacterized protein n=1 Tax=Nezara viridula TaxID=85310 RepID=A0A9P0HBN6_NEZVI|nr:unnamed protein product [Nezara viridula]